MFLDLRKTDKYCNSHHRNLILHRMMLDSIQLGFLRDVAECCDEEFARQVEHSNLHLERGEFVYHYEGC